MLVLPQSRFKPYTTSTRNHIEANPNISAKSKILITIPLKIVQVSN